MSIEAWAKDNIRTPNVDTALPLRSAPKIFTALADALEWVVRQTGVKVVLHYLDDFLLVGELASEQCKDNLQKLLAVFTALHIPVAREKLEGTTTRLSFLGIELDTHLMVLRLPQEKIEELRALLAHFMANQEVVPIEGPSIPCRETSACL